MVVVAKCFICIKIEHLTINVSTINDRLKSQGGDMAIFIRNYVKLDILIKCSSIDTRNKANKTLFNESKNFRKYTCHLYFTSFSYQYKLST